MAYQVIWTAEADNDLFKTAEYLKENWSPTSAEKFISQVLKRVEKIADMPSLGRPTTKENYFMYRIDRKNVLFFTIEENYLILLSIYPYKKDISKSTYY